VRISTKKYKRVNQNSPKRHGLNPINPLFYFVIFGQLEGQRPINLLAPANRIPVHPRYFPVVITPSQKKQLNKDSIEETILVGALKKERA